MQGFVFQDDWKRRKDKIMRTANIAGTTTLLLALCAIPCSAQRSYRGYPPGNYVETCRNIHVEGDRLEAECQERDGDWRRTSLDDFNRCTSEIANNDGRLVCAQGNYGDRRGPGYGDDDGGRGYYRGGWQGEYPPGDYVQTCRNIYTEGNRLVADCQKRDGGWRRSSLDNVDLCTDQIVNNNGRLVCPQGEGEGGYGYDRGYRGGWQGDIPSGTYTQTCRNIHVAGDRLIADCQKRNGDWRSTALDDVQSCTSAPANDNGRLVCGR
jgi:hypothetical protein